MRKRLAAAVAVLACGGLTAGAAAAATPTHDTSISSNWAGYAVSGIDTATGTPTSFSVVSGSWTIPTVTCTGTSPTYSAAWIGLGGFNPDAPALEQTGSESDCSFLGPTYTVWYELVPAPAVTIHLKVSPGDRMSAVVVVVVHGSQVILRIRNLTRNTVFTKTTTAPLLDLTSAEWVVEAPATCDSGQHCRVLPLSNFGSVSFTGAATVGDGHTGTVADGAWTATPIELLARHNELAPDSPTNGAIPSALGPDGGSFSVGYSDMLTTPSG